jgi:drug/metabolite transporter (DMT)-like permease
MFVGIAGVTILARFDVGVLDIAIIGAIACCLGAACSYGISSNYTRRYVNGAPALGMAAFSQTAAVVWLLPLAILYPPSGAISSAALVAVSLLGVLATGIAYILFFQLVVDVGPVVSLTVTFLVPIMAFLWGAVFLNEQITLITIVGGGVVLLGTALTIGIEKLRPQPRLT